MERLIELVGNLCQTASLANTVCYAGTFSTDDLWLRVGKWNVWDLKVGRFEGWEVADSAGPVERETSW